MQESLPASVVLFQLTAKSGDYDAYVIEVSDAIPEFRHAFGGVCDTNGKDLWLPRTQLKGLRVCNKYGLGLNLARSAMPSRNKFRVEVNTAADIDDWGTACLFLDRMLRLRMMRSEPTSCWG
jgi:hypothetical protein